MTFGERVTLHRKQLKLSQHDLAGKVGTSAPIIGRYERDEIKPSIETAKKIADELRSEMGGLASRCAAHFSAASPVSGKLEARPKIRWISCEPHHIAIS